MTAPVAVLGELAAMALHHGEKWEAIHDAVSALIDADKNYDAMVQRQGKYPCPGMDEHVRRAKFRRAVALARCGGSQ